MGIGCKSPEFLVVSSKFHFSPVSICKMPRMCVCRFELPAAAEENPSASCAWPEWLCEEGLYVRAGDDNESEKCRCQQKNCNCQRVRGDSALDKCFIVRWFLRFQAITIVGHNQTLVFVRRLLRRIWCAFALFMVGIVGAVAIALWFGGCGGAAQIAQWLGAIVGCVCCRHHTIETGEKQSL